MTDLRCGCCEGTEPLTPLPTANRPGLDALRYRVGTHATFFETMVAHLSSHRLADGRRPLQRLTTRETNDPALALLDAWATVADVLTFYQERIANEGYLLTATERRSVLELARLVGYRLRPGVAASVYLAFTLEQDYEIEIPAGTRAQSVPDPGDLPQAFETDEALPARTAWNAILARQTRPPFLEPVTFDGTRTFYVQGVVNTLKANDAVLFVCGSIHQPYTIQAAEPDAAADHTLATYTPFNAGFSGDIGENGRDGEPLPEKGSALTRLATVVEALRKDPSLPPASRFQLARTPGQTYSTAADLGPRLLTQFDPKLKDTLYTAYANAPVTGVSQPECEVEAFRVKAAPFGHNAPQELVFNDDNVLAGRREWALLEYGGTARVRITSTNADQNVVQAFGGFLNLTGEINPLRIEAALADDQGIFRYSETLEVRDLIDPAQPPFGEDNPVFTTSLPLGPDDAYTVVVEAAYDGPFVSDAYDDAQLRHVALRFSRGLEETDIQISLVPAINGSSSSFNVRVDGDPPREISLGDERLDTIANRTVAISLEGGLDVTHRTPALATAEQFRTLSLDAAYDAILPGSYVLIDRAGDQAIVAQVQRVRTISRADYGISAKVTQLVLDAAWISEQDTSLAITRGTTVYAQSEQLELAEEPIEADVAGDVIELDGLYDGLEAGRWLVVKGERTDVLDAEGQVVEGVEASELVMLAGVEHNVQTVEDASGNVIELPGDTLHTRLTLSEPLAYTYTRSTVTVNANVAHATHGETRDEVLGSGDGAQAFQQFTLKQHPLTYVAAPTPDGAESTLEVRVDDVRWPERETLLYLDGDDRGYITRRDDEDKTTVVFGDGKQGTRLPTGVENVTVVYRSGIGKIGNVAAEQISILATRPLGVKDVINPQRASGGADPESRDQARRNVPLAVLALDRLVAVQDYADFARTFAGIGKASAAALSDGRREVVHLTIAGADDVPIDAYSDLYRNLMLALRRFGDPNQPVRVALREAVFVFLSARVQVLDDYLWDHVEPEIRTALLDAFSFDRRDLGQDVLLSEVISTIQHVEGVDYVDVDLLDGVSETDAADPEMLADKLDALATALGPGSSTGCPADAQPRQRLVADPARIDPTATDPALRIRPAQVAYLNPDLPDTLILTEVSS